MLELISLPHLEKILLKKPDWLLVEITAAWVGATKIMRPILEETLSHCREEVISYTVHGKLQDSLIMNMGVPGFPVYILWQCGEERQRWVGIQPKDQWQQEIYHWLGKRWDQVSP
ncbi:MAG TPA: hypothetical protein DCE41_22860 [Cytophagales bacterium]|nr:hypothetical protein [Cytophagales bacterium]HAA22881.1 hypothetical protein [Cytophagales bacterium]HAP60546.1 hypothetical protein [Cytophagales bacterium]